MIDPREKRILTAHVLGQTPEWLVTHPETQFTPKQKRQLKSLITRRKKGEPLAYLIRHKEFYGLNFVVNKNVLIPRPETEHLIDEILKPETRNSKHYSRPIHWMGSPKSEIRNKIPETIIDVGTGSGCLAIVMATLLPGMRIIATDISPAALRVARRNARRHKVANRIKFIRTNLLPKNIKPDIIVANLPYLTTREWRTLPFNIKKYEPRSAFDGGPDSLKYYRKLFSQIKKAKLSPLIILEIDPRRSQRLKRLTKKYFPKSDIKIKKDLAGLKRVMIIAFTSLSTT